MNEADQKTHDWLKEYDRLFFDEGHTKACGLRLMAGKSCNCKGDQDNGETECDSTAAGK